MGLITQLNLLAEEILAVFCSTGLTCNIYFLENAFCMQISSFGYCEATDQQISYPPGLILWFIFLMLLPFLHVSSPESLCPRLCTSCDSKHGRRRIWEIKASGTLGQVEKDIGCARRRGRSHGCHGMFTSLISGPPRVTRRSTGV